MIQFVRTFAERVKQRRRFELALVVVLGLAGFAMSGTGPDPNFCRVLGPSHTSTQETTRVVRVVVVAARLARRPRVVALAPTRPATIHVRLTPPAPAPAPFGRLARLPARVRGPPATAV